MKSFQFIFITIYLLFYLFLTATPTIADSQWIPPQPPFSKEGNPEKDYFFGEFFDLYKFIKPQNLQIYENEDRSRKYENIWVCGGKGGPKNPRDHRDYHCTWQDQSCDGGDVEMCEFNGDVTVRLEHSSPNGSCTAKPPSPEYPNGKDGTCSYKKLPTISNFFSGTDFSNASDLTYNKIQSEAGRYTHKGDDNNPITHGSLQLAPTLNEKILLQLIVIKKAKQTKNTLHETKEWPLGWVDWGYTTPNGKTLIEINDELPDSVAVPIINVIEQIDNFYISGGDMDNIPNYGDERIQIYHAIDEALTQDPRPTWLTDVMQAPIFPPSWRVDYVRPSICVWKICCPGYRCLVPFPIGVKRGLYFDNSISQAFNAALYDLFLRNFEKEGIKQFQKIATKNPLIRFVTVASPKATKTKINERLTKEMIANDPCYKYRSGFGSWLAFGTHMDYLEPNSFFDKEKKCPDYNLMPELDKQNAEAFSSKNIFTFIAMKWGQDQDDVDFVRKHLLTIPEVMGQSIADIKQPVLDTQDILEVLEENKEFNYNLSNTVNNKSKYLYAGKFPFESRRLISTYYPCNEPMYSSYKETNIDRYVKGFRSGCFPSQTLNNKCNGELFSKIIADSPWKEPTSQATQIVLNSAMFKDGKLNPELEEIYAQVEKETGVPCEVLAGHHFEEASTCFTETHNPTQCSAANGNDVRDQGGFLETVRSAARSVARYPFSNTKNLIASMSWFNGGGNANCQRVNGVAIPYNHCPPQFIGEDDPYVTHLLDDQHMNMYQIYCDDSIICNPIVSYDTERPGAFAVALAVYNNATKNNSSNSSNNE